MSDLTIAVETADDHCAIDELHAVSFGPGRFARAAFRLREQGGHDPALSFVARNGIAPVLGSVRLTWIGTTADQPPGLLLGPLAVVPFHKNAGIGRALMKQAMDAASRSDAAYVLLVGDRPYYAPFGFEPVMAGRLSMPGPVDPARLLMAAFTDAASGVRGMVRHRDLVVMD